MIVEIRGANTTNKGAELMLRTAVQELNDTELAVEPRVGSFAERSSLGLLQKAALRQSDKPTNMMGSVFPKKLRNHLRTSYGIVYERDVNAIIDASGFAYSDQFDLQRSQLAAERSTRWKAQGKKLILLPQALGPFEEPKRREAFQTIARNANLVFAREQTSYDYALGTGMDTGKLRLAPDFSCLLEGVTPPSFQPTKELVFIVPSAKLLTETSAEIKQSYLPFLADVSQSLLDKDIDVRILLHERNDTKIVQDLQDRLNGVPPIVTYENAVHLKGVISHASLLIGSRFHALVSALTQGVPAIAIGWSHKYQELFGGYGCADMVVDPTSADMTKEVAYEMVRGKDGHELRKSLLAGAAIEKQKSKAMWAEVRTTLGLQPKY